MSLVIGDSCDADCENVDVTEEDDNVFIASGSVIEESAGTASSLSGLTVLCARRPTIPLIHVGGGEEASSDQLQDELHSSRPSGLRPPTSALTSIASQRVRKSGRTIPPLYMDPQTFSYIAQIKI